MKQQLSFIIYIAWSLGLIHAQNTVSLSAENLIPYGVQLKSESYKGKQALVLEQAGDNDKQYTYALIKNSDFHNGIIELNLAGQPKTNASVTARGFVGIVFRAAADTSKFELIYLRPTNGRADDQVRRNHSVQYVSHPGYPWEKLRKEFPEKYESYADQVAGEWTKIKLIVKDETVQLFVNGAEQPALIVNDLKQGKDKRGSVGLWIGIGTVAQFSDLYITKLD